ncbi:hypothetical protein PVAG01_05608 [Phlyctema vagabunda]|uniref:Uncharacterized protein n=1 Tax=Phlyctema vagabunda TaxID=108571 RepID=A0ABR4PLP1_9HELO
MFPTPRGSQMGKKRGKKVTAQRMEVGSSTHTHTHDTSSFNMRYKPFRHATLASVARTSEA